jgi:multidrug efflux system membrane fusion protein
VPLAAVIRDPAHPNRFAVMVADGSGDLVSAHLQSVDLGDPSGNMIVVKGGLTSGQRVITTGVTLVRNGDTVRVIP